MGRTVCTEPQCLYKGALYLYLTVELYLYSPYGPYGLYRASVPVQGCTLPLPLALPLQEHITFFMWVNPLTHINDNGKSRAVSKNYAHFNLLYIIQ